jgi:hypothetical protein
VGIEKQLTERSPSRRCQQSQSRGRCCVQQQGRNHHGWSLSAECKEATDLSKRPRLLTDGGLERVGGTEHDTASLDGVKSLPNHGNNGAGRHVLDQAGEEGLALEIGVVCD